MIYYLDSRVAYRVVSNSSYLYHPNPKENLYDGGNYRAEGSSKLDASGLKLDEPLEIVHAYLQDERFQKLRHFDAGRHVSRTARIEGTTFSSIGLAL